MCDLAVINRTRSKSIPLNKPLDTPIKCSLKNKSHSPIILKQVNLQNYSDNSSNLSPVEYFSEYTTDESSNIIDGDSNDISHDDLIFGPLSDDEFSTSKSNIAHIPKQLFKSASSVESNDLHFLSTQIKIAQSNDDYDYFIKYYNKYEELWNEIKQFNSIDSYFSPRFFLIKAMYDPGCNKIHLKIRDKIKT